MLIAMLCFALLTLFAVVFCDSKPWRIVAVALFVAFALACSDASAGPVRCLLHKITHPLEGVREHRAERQAHRQPQRLPTGPAAPSTSAAPKSLTPCPPEGCPIPPAKKK